ncbi:hypothetical protein ABER23_12770 [Paenibacillus lautus]|uniref:hypothetical protein n=1 Tax=Paenibacillus lautus TaxID=1401 RepID=UPI003D2DE76E
MASFFHVNCPEEVSSKYRLIVFDDSKEAFIPLTEYYHDQVNRISESSVDRLFKRPGTVLLLVKVQKSLQGQKGLVG